MSVALRRKMFIHTDTGVKWIFLSHSTQGVLNRNLGDAVAPRASKKLVFFYTIFRFLVFKVFKGF